MCCISNAATRKRVAASPPTIVKYSGKKTFQIVEAATPRKSAWLELEFSSTCSVELRFAQLANAGSLPLYANCDSPHRCSLGLTLAACVACQQTSEFRSATMRLPARENSVYTVTQFALRSNNYLLTL